MCVDRNNPSTSQSDAALAMGNVLVCLTKPEPPSHSLSLVCAITPEVASLEFATVLSSTVLKSSDHVTIGTALRRMVEWEATNGLFPRIHAMLTLVQTSKRYSILATATAAINHGVCVLWAVCVVGNGLSCDRLCVFDVCFMRVQLCIGVKTSHSHTPLQ